MNDIQQDLHARQQAIDISQSFIVQAPAGSGKTELLTQRFLKLLAHVDDPEEIIAITFTRKAAAEMRQRIVSALLLAQQQQLPTESHKQITHALAQQALARDNQLHWHLLDNPNRLRILTIDALAGFLSAQIPILAGFGKKPDISEDAWSLYEAAARELIQSISEDNPWRSQLQTLLRHLDNQTDRAVKLLSHILAKREQWLPHILRYHDNHEQLHQHLQQGLINIANEAIQEVAEHINPDLFNQIYKLGFTAADNLISEDPEHTWFQLQQPNPEPIHQHLDFWQTLCDLLLTQKGEWRKSITKRQGFPAKSEEKAQMQMLLQSLADDTLLRDYLVELRYAPGIDYSESQQLMIDALTQLLPLLYAQLRLVFQSQETIDFVELNLAALRALGDDEEATDLALYLDYQIQHLLIDEFQDTSITQFSLIQRLTRGWEPDDGRSLFLVGDPMQSIYRFRDAEVGLFLRAEQQGINDIALTKLTLKQNYRSNKTIIDWVNQTFVTLFPTHADITQGAVPYANAIPSNTTQGDVKFYAHIGQSAKLEAATLIKTIQQLQQDNPDGSIAVLVRSRAHLNEITPLLQQHQLTYQAVDLQTLSDCPIIQDLVTLTRAILHREDRIAWLALLRSPICGLTLADLHTIAQHTQTSIWQCLSAIKLTSKDSQIRLKRITDALQLFFEEQGRKPIELAIQGLWRLLGMDSIATTQQLHHAERFFKLIAELANTDGRFTVTDLIKKLNKTYIEPQQSNSKLAIMTIHKSKGLEFDHVILPSLNSKIAINKHDLMLWLERPNWQGSSDFILAPIKHATDTLDPVYDYLSRIEKRKLEFESARLLYVAVTRAKQSLHLSACLDSDDDGALKPKPGSFADMLAIQFSNNIIDTHITTSETITTTASLKRVPSHWQPKFTCHRDDIKIPSENPLPPLESNFKRIVGTGIHVLLAQQKTALSYAEKHLLQLGLQRHQLHQAIDLIQIALANIKADPRAHWILDPNHEDSHFEYPVTTIIKNKIRHLIIDRTFIDYDTRWIIDYKTAMPPNDDHQAFMQAELAQYQSQLNAYAKAMAGLSNHPIQTALYFPMCCGWITNEIPIA